jgi:DNA polymerase-1
VTVNPAPGSARLMLLDTNGLIYRAFFALPELTTSKGVHINAAYGFTQMLTKIVADEKPTHVIACFDLGKPAARVAMYADYKAQRQTMPDTLRPQFALVRRILEAYGIPAIDMEGEEADDVIATLARKAAEAGQTVDVVTGDLDLLQIVSDRITVLATRRGITDLGRYDPQAVLERFELEPKRLPDYRGLKGDPSDNLPGVPGIGEKTAIKLIKAAGSLDALLADPTLAGTPKLEALIREHGEMARLCRDVSIVGQDLPIDVPWESARYAPPSSDVLYPLYRDLEFKTLLNRLEPPAAAPTLPIDAFLEGRYDTFEHVTDPPDFVRLAKTIAAAASSPRPAIAIGADGALAIAPAEGEAFSLRSGALAYDEVARAMREFTAHPALVAHDAKALHALLREHGVALNRVADDTMVLAHLIDPARSYTAIGDAASHFLDRALPGDAAAAADAALRLAPIGRAQLAERGQSALYEQTELPLVLILANMEARGIAVDPAELDVIGRECAATIDRLQSEIYDLAGEPFNIGSPQQLGTVLFERLGIPSGGRTKTGYATGSEVLVALARDYPICAKVLEFREVTKLKNTYIDVLPKLVGNDGRLRTIFNQTSTATGRLSSTNPNLQNIPVRSELGRRIRKAFVAPGPSRLLLAADYNQIELRIMAHLSGDEAMREAFRRGDDIHDFTARGLFSIPDGAQADPNQRRIAKSVNFGLLYGMSDFGLAQRLEIPRAEAKEITAAYFARFPSVREYIERTLEAGRERGYVETILGRRRYMPDLRARNYAMRAAAEREATNAPMQGSASDLMKLAMVKLDTALRDRGLGAEMLLQIHDELIFEIDADRRDEIARVVKHEMEHALELSVPIEVTLKSGANWYDVAGLDVDDED